MAFDTSPFDFVRAFDQMRQGLGGAPPLTPPPELQAAPPVDGPTSTVAPAAPTGGGAPGQGTAVYFNKLRAQFPGLRMTSGYRDPAHNAAVGGVANSYHTQKDAFGNPRASDFVGSAKDMQAAAAWAKVNGAKEVLIHNVGSGQHLHVAW